MGNCQTKDNHVSMPSRPSKGGKDKEDIMISKKTNIMNSSDFDDDKGVNDVTSNDVRKKKVTFPHDSTTYYDDPRKYEEKIDIWCTALELQQYTDDIRVVLIKAAEKQKQMELTHSKGMMDHRDDDEDDEDDDDDDDDDEDDDNCCLRGLEEFYEDGMFSSEELRHHHMQSILKIQRYEQTLMTMKIQGKTTTMDDGSMNSSSGTTLADLEKKNQLLHAVKAKIGKIESSRAIKRAKQDQLDANDYHYNTHLAHLIGKTNKHKHKHGGSKKKHMDPALSDNYSKNTIAHNTTSAQPPQRNAAAARSA